MDEERRKYNREYQRAYIKTPKGSAAHRKATWKHRTGLGFTVEQYDVLFKKQGGACAICGRATKTHLYVDHDHTTGEVRGLLCSSCNLGLGNFKDSVPIMRQAILYLGGTSCLKL